MRIALLTCLFLAAASPDAAMASAGDVKMAVWPMDETTGSSWMDDVSGRGHHGQIGPEVGTGLTTEYERGYRFERLEPDTPPARPGHLVSVADHSDLDPGGREFAVTVRLRTTHKFGNIIQKGQATVPGGSWKMQIPNGRATCTYRGSRGTIELIAPYRINDGDWHVVRCVRLDEGVFLSIDGFRAASRDGWTGTIDNDWPVTIGGKLDCDQVEVGCDYYAGDLDWITIEAA
ncbi:laminin G domain-containing protein [Actinoplanes subglobosus]|uniref:Laminin G domain-containing protein n=1 Tax=Actinoplanes subglobosus TaxID=1547892 RepID=A0ABV8J840_9ACTN